MVCRNQLRIALRLTTMALLIGAVGAGYLLLRAESFIKSRVVAAIESAVPHWDIRVDDVRFDGAQARVFGVKLKARGQVEDVIEIPELVVLLDQTALANGQAIVPESIQVRQPTIHLIRRADGSLNIDDLKPWPQTSSGSTPLAEIQRATVHVEQAGQKAQVRDLDVILTPEARGQYGVAGTGRVDDFGDVAVTGSVNAPRSEIDIKLAGRLRVDDRLVETVAAWHPDVGQKIAAWSRSGVQLASTSVGPDAHGIAGPAGLGLTAETELLVELKKAGDQPFEWKVQTEIVRGEIDNPLFPLPLYNLSGKISVTSDGVRIEQLAAANGSSGFSVQGTAANLKSGGTQKVFKITAEDVSLDGPLRRFLTPGLQKVHNLLNPHGRVNIEATIDESGARVTQWNLVSLEVHDGAFSCNQFPYPVTQVSGRAWQDGQDVALKFTGKAGTREIDIEGRVIDAGPGAGFDILISADGLPIDTQLIEALGTPVLRKVKDAAEALRVNGKLDGMVRVKREPHAQRGSRPSFRVDVGLREGSLQYRGFPYRLENASGSIRFDEIDEPDGLWHFKNLVANRDDARVQAEGAFVPPRTTSSSFAALDPIGTASPGMLDLTIQASQLPIDRDLETAVTTAIPELKPVLDELAPQGKVSAKNLQVKWVPGSTPEIAIPNIHLSHGSIRINAFPYRWSDVEATFRKDDTKQTKVFIESLSAKHQGTTLSLRTDRASLLGQNRPAASFAEGVPGGWQVALYGLEIRDLLLDQELQRAVPNDLAETLRILNVRRAVDVVGDLLVVDTPKRPFTIAARGVVELPGNDATAGIDLTEVRGQILVDRVVASKEKTELDGRIAIDQMRALNMLLSNVRGPLRYTDGVLRVGSEKMLNDAPEDRTSIPEQERLTAAFYGGGVGLDIRATTLTGGEFSYDIAATMSNADLNLWSADMNLAEVDMHGKMDGEVRVSGLSNDIKTLRGEDGYLTISRARLWSLPTVAQMTSVLSFRPPDNTAFRHVYLNFDVHDGLFDFKRVDLYGNNLSFVGKGQAYFREEDKGRINFNFGSYVPPNNSSMASRLWASLGDNWIYVKVGGTIGYPVITKQPRLPLFDGLSAIMRSVETGQLVAPRSRPRPAQ